ncbi:glutathione S-transferase [Sphingobium sp.]|uniref:glutathione S-transferase n=1 Tax=Sphingobium sp. TaxID=1912891 RepID=UPI0035C6AA74
MTPILYSFRRCPYAMRARMALLASGQAVELREILLRDKPTPMLEASPKGTVPVLLLPDGSVLEQSLDIMRWALDQNDPQRWLAGEDSALIAANDGPFKTHLDRYKYASRHASDPLAHRNEATAWLGELESRLERSRHLTGDRANLTDIAIFPFVRQFAATEPDWFAGQPLPQVRRWLGEHLASDVFARAMLRVKPWAEGDAPLFLR